MTAEEMLTAFSKIKDACDANERMEITPGEAMVVIAKIVAPIDTSPVE